MYCLIAYKPANSNWIIGSHIETHHSDFTFSNGLTREQLINTLSCYIKQNKTNEEEYQFIILHSGIVIYDTNTGPQFDGSMLGDFKASDYLKQENKKDAESIITIASNIT